MIITCCPRLDLADVAQSLQRGHPGERQRGRLLKGQVRRSDGQPVLGHGDELGERAEADEPVHLVAGPEPGGAGTDGLDLAGDVAAEDGVLRATQPGAGQPGDVGQAAHEVPVPRVQRRRPHADQHLAGPRLRGRDGAQSEDLGRAEDGVGDGRHLLGSRGAELGRGEVGDLVPADGFEERLDTAVDQAAQGVVVDLDVGHAGRQADRSGRRGPGEGDLRRDGWEGCRTWFDAKTVGAAVASVELRRRCVVRPTRTAAC